MKRLLAIIELVKIYILRACLYDPGQAGRDAYRDAPRNTNSNECLYDAANYPA